MSANKTSPKIQRALVLQGGGALGAYEAGVLNILSRNLRIDTMDADGMDLCIEMNGKYAELYDIPKKLTSSTTRND